MLLISPDRYYTSFTPGVMVPRMRGRTPAEPLKEFPNRLREWRNARGLSLEKLGELTHQKYQSVARHETGENQITLAQLDVYARALNIKPEELLKDSVRISPTMRDLLAIGDNLPPTEQERLLGMVRAFAGPARHFDPERAPSKLRQRRG